MRTAAVIMAGGSGKRFWPLSREAKAKQSLPLFSEKTLLQETIERMQKIADHIFVVAAEKQKSAINSDCAPYPEVSVVFEPEGRNTAPCVALATRVIQEKWGDDTLVMVVPADHYIADPAEFRCSLSAAADYLSDHPETIGTVGILPTGPETGYGYIEKGGEIMPGIYAVKRFVEKPDFHTAEKFFASGNYLWNGGIFLFIAATMQRQFSDLAPDILEKISEIQDPFHITAEEYRAVRSISIDYAIMEKTECPVVTVPSHCGWNDVGSWKSYFMLLEKDKKGNAGKGDVHFIECENCLCVNLTDMPVIMLGKKSELMVATKEAVLVADLEKDQDVKKVTEYLALSFSHLL